MHMPALIYMSTLCGKMKGRTDEHGAFVALGAFPIPVLLLLFVLHGHRVSHIFRRCEVSVEHNEWDSDNLNS